MFTASAFETCYSSQVSNTTNHCCIHYLVLGQHTSPWSPLRRILVVLNVMLAVTVRCADRSAGDRASTAQYSTATLGCVRSAVRCFVGGYNGLAADSMASRAKSSLRHGVQPWTSFFGRRPRLDLSDAVNFSAMTVQDVELLFSI